MDRFRPLICLLALAGVPNVAPAPTLDYGTYFGGDDDDTVTAVAVDAAGSMFLAGHTQSADFPSKNPLQTDGRLFLAKLDPTGSHLEFSTRLGSSGFDELSAIAVDGGGDVWLVGRTSATDFPTVGALQPTPGGKSDAFVMEVRGDGSAILFATYLGGLSEDLAHDVVVDGLGHVHVVGETGSVDFPVAQPVQPIKSGYIDAFAAGIDPAGPSLLYSTFLGGYDEDRATGVAVDGAGNVLVAGMTFSDNFPVTAGALQTSLAGWTDGFVAKLLRGTRMVYGTYLGGTMLEGDVSVAAGDGGEACLVGWTGSDDFPLSTPLQPTRGGDEDLFLTRLSADGASLRFSTYLGGEYRDEVVGVELDAADRIHLAGTTNRSFPLVDSLMNDGPGFACRVESDGSALLYSTLFYGAETRAMTVDGTGTVVMAGETWATDLPVEAPFQAEKAGRHSHDGFVVRLGAATGPVRPFFTADRRDGSPPLQVMFRDLTGGTVNSRLWTLGDGAVSSDATPWHEYADPGGYTVSLTVDTPRGAGTETRVDYVRVVSCDFIGAPLEGAAPLTVAFSNLCSGPVSGYEWRFGDGGTSSSPNPVHTYADPGAFDVELRATIIERSVGEGKNDYVTAYPFYPDFVGTPRIGRPPLTVTFHDRTPGADSWLWSFGDGGTSDLPNPVHTYATEGRYDVGLTASVQGTSVTRAEPDYILVSVEPPDTIVAAPGPDPRATPLVRGFDVLGEPLGPTSFVAYGVPGFGTRVGGGDLDGTGPAEILTGPGPGGGYGPQVRAFRANSVPVAGLDFYAYGTLQYGVIPDGIELDGDGFAEIETGPGPGAIFGPHVRGFDFDGTVVRPNPGVSYFAYGTLKYGVDVSRGQVEGAPEEELLTAPGPGVVFGPQVRGFRCGPPVSGIAKLNFDAFASLRYGARIGTGELDRDDWWELLVGAGPGPAYGAAVRGFDYDGSMVQAIARLSFVAYSTTKYGAEVKGGELDGDGDDDLLVSPGPDPAASARARGFQLLGGVTPIPALDFVAYGTVQGLHTAPLDLGYR